METFFKGMVGTTPSLTALDVSANQIGGYSDDDDFFIPVMSPGDALSTMLKDNKSITSLKASYCNMGMHAVDGLAKALAGDGTENNRTLTLLDVSAGELLYGVVVHGLQPKSPKLQISFAVTWSFKIWMLGLDKLRT